MRLVSLCVAREHLRPPGEVDDVRIYRMIEEASAIVLDYLKLPFDAYHDSAGELVPELVPPAVRAATLLVLGALYDNADGQNPDKQPLSDAVKALLHSRRVPTLA